jgi:hypothetical protein
MFSLQSHAIHSYSQAPGSSAITSNSFIFTRPMVFFPLQPSEIHSYSPEAGSSLIRRSRSLNHFLLEPLPISALSTLPPA